MKPVVLRYYMTITLFYFELVSLKAVVLVQLRTGQCIHIVM